MTTTALDPTLFSVEGAETLAACLRVMDRRNAIAASFQEMVQLTGQNMRPTPPMIDAGLAVFEAVKPASDDDLHPIMPDIFRAMLAGAYSSMST